MSAHTPGPWMAYKNPAQKEASEEQWSIGLADSFEKYGFIGIRDDAYMMVGGVCTESDARLMAAAPELLEAAERLMEHYAHCLPDHMTNEFRECIAKAKGKS